ncbi:A24 family peptidase [Mycobacterium sp. SMC-8]|uniref:prepilin peptidase n=1 Tax=Mycobacterium sp. SMC-8 TaxID=2857060 RepID=UPI0021B2BDD6|nr:A24 family peptidase [Mycobacterium sp. SMC-8]UXA10517.1 A24 family peptidase [Mycobacterium sp. SMC-8]
MGELWSTAAAVAVSVWLIALSAFDFRYHRLPNLLTVPGAAVILVAAVVTGHGAAATLGAAALFSVYAGVHLVAPAAMGAGDVKLAAGLGALTGAFGADVWVLAAVGASLLTAMAAMCLRLAGSAPTVPHGPSMCLATGAVLTVALHTPGI